MRKVTGNSKNIPGHSASYSSHIPTVFWILANAMCLVALMMQAMTIYTPKWRVAKPIAYSYMHMGTRRQHLVGETSYGLHLIKFNNGGFSQTWQAKVESVKSKGYTAIQYNEQVGKGTYRSLYGSYCPAACRNAILVRMEGYERMMKLNNNLTLVLVVVCTLAGMGIGWYILFDADVMVSSGFWVTAAVLAVGGLYYWKTHTHELWKMICMSQQIPYPALGDNVWYTYAAAALFVGGSALLVLAGFFYNWRHTRRMQRMLNDHLQNQQNNVDPFGDPSSLDMLKQKTPFAPAAEQNQQGMNPGQLFSGIGFGQGQQQGYQYPSGASPTGPSMWNTNLQY
ncbi:uncharacterized protein BXIN_2398 [Babesia sp. Xinjiang]|uniref:uncharacterized protein n=1 Tax=Babesia sp. Xinjiang TaxID=462227 RepID=UPI000A25D3A1|nr:uncharacterized protein BXIN_2398 [Babesia sp. Xinjiang]ORM40643.1 hypothetical protein BXIN_2398 [Babesia sp. Xinjiang]